MKNKVFRKSILLLLIVVFSFSLSSCSKKKDQKDAEKSELNTEDKVASNDQLSAQQNSLDSQVTPIQNVEKITDEQVVDSLIKEVSQVDKLEKSADNKGVSLIVKHDGKLKEVPVEYPLVNWVSEQNKPVLIEFVAEYSEPAKKSLPYLYGIAEKYMDKFLVCKVDIEQNEEFIDSFELEYLPTYYISKNLTLFNVATGFDPYAQPSIIDNIEKVISQ